MRLPPFQLERFFARYEFNVAHVLCASDCESMTVADLLALEPAAAERFAGLWLGYTESQGSPTLRHAICDLYTTIAPEHVLVCAGAEEAIFLFMHAALEAGDHIIVHWPCYQSLVEVARGIGCDVTLWRADEAAGWALDPDALRRSLRPNTRAIVINTPHNPTGYHIPPALFHEIHAIAAGRGILLFSDEVYRELEYQAADRLPAACDMGGNAVSLGVMSKSYGLAGLRLGWVATQHADLVARMAALKDYTTICTAAPSEFLAELALRHRQSLTERNMALIQRNLATLDGFFARHPERFVWRRPTAGPIAFPRLLGEDVDAFCAALAHAAGVLLLPGSVYGDAGNHFRIGCGRRDLPQAAARLEEYLVSRRAAAC